jgi:hypothetical protein
MASISTKRIAGQFGHTDGGARGYGVLKYCAIISLTRGKNDHR